MPLSIPKTLIRCLLYRTSVFPMTVEKLLSPLSQKHKACLKIMRFDMKPLRHQDSTFLEGPCRRQEQKTTFWVALFLMKTEII